ncbi:glyoxalase-like domain-containing protein [Gymnopilus junonius]|uniref:Glyoxalase-like domain-containing protein n=1 Tax=Gymnopilus junonius TaxID=109634 RepID=A0A9P5TLH0_GYMJU|nr:glyoxalase-like domain-containing protein [Gymnopilus junonius]
MPVNTRTLDHIVHLTPPGSLEETSKQWRELGFQVLPGGVHTDGLTENALVVLSDGVYIELISFTHPASHYPPGSPARIKRDNHRWGHLPYGWIDFAFLGTGSRAPGESISETINERSKKEGTGVEYTPEVDGGRTRADGVVLKWLINSVKSGEEKVLPFFCGDVTPRKLRVPSDPPENTVHPSGALGIAHVHILAEPSSFNETARQITSVLGPSSTSFVTHDAPSLYWNLDTQGAKFTDDAQLVLSTPIGKEEEAFVQGLGKGIYEVRFFLKVDDETPDSQRTPYGRIGWVIV